VIKVKRFKHQYDFELEHLINTFLDENVDHSFVSISTVELGGDFIAPFFVTFVAFKDHSQGGYI
jgi:hypothetical protein